MRRLLLALLAGPAMAQTGPAPPPASAATALTAATKPPAKPSAPLVLTATPNAERVVVIGALNKRSGETRNFIGKPGQQFDFHGLRVTVRSCETTPPWEQQLTGAFLQIDERRVTRTGTSAAPQRIFSGWMFAQSPSLNVLESPRYDIWVKSCTMRWPDRGAATVLAGQAGPRPPAAASTATKSAATPSAPPN